MGEGIAEAKALAMEGAAGAANMEKGSGLSATQQLQDQDKDKKVEGQPAIPLGYFSFKERNKYAADLAKDHEVYNYLYDWYSATGTTTDDYVPYGALGDYSSSFGGKSLAKGKRSSASGTTTLALANYSHAEGDVSVAMGNDSHVEGYETTTGPDAIAAHAEGSQTQALAEAAHAEGIYSIAAGYGSHAGGIGTITAAQGQYAIGCYNIPDDNAMFIIGGGDNNDNRKNLFKVDNDSGKVWILDENGIQLSLQDQLAHISKLYQIIEDQKKVIDDLNSAGSNRAMRYTFNVAGENVSQVTKKAYAGGSKVSFKYYIPEGTNTQWWGLAYSTSKDALDIYAAADANRAHKLTTTVGSWTDVEFTLPEGGDYYLYFGSEVGNWKLADGSNAYVLIDDFKVGDVEETFDKQTAVWIFDILQPAGITYEILD
jgi:hypothetical protein